MTNSDVLVKTTEVTDLYYDNFAEEFVEEKDTYAPPERYIHYGTTGTEDQYVEVWMGDRNVEIVVRYSTADIEAERVNARRQQEASDFGAKIRRLAAWYLPTPKWRELMKLYRGEINETYL